MPIDSSIYRGIDTQYGLKLADLFNPNSIAQRQAAVDEQNMGNQLRQMQVIQGVNQMNRAPVLAQREEQQYQSQQAEAQRLQQERAQKLALMEQLKTAPPEQRAGIFAQMFPEEAAKAAFKPAEKLPDWKDPAYWQAKRGQAQFEAGLKAAGGVNGEQYGKLQPGFRRVKDQASGAVMDEAIPGSSPYQKLKGQYAQDTAAVTNAISDADTLATRAKALKDHAGLKGLFGVQGYFPSIKGGEAGRADALLNELKNSMQLAGFQQLRSTTGSPGAMTEKEWPKLEAAITQLQNSSNLEDAKTALGNIEIYAKRIKNVSSTAYKNEWGGSQFERERGIKPTPGATGQWEDL